MAKALPRIPPAVVEEILARSAGLCECCGRPHAGEYALHHRHPRDGQRTDNRAVNLMVVRAGFDGGCHNLGRWSIHGQPKRSYELGHLVRRGVDPATVPVLLLDREDRVLRFR